MTDELKPLPCPFCGGNAELNEWPEPFKPARSTLWSVRCCKVETDWEETAEAAIAAWNTRPSDTPDTGIDAETAKKIRSKSHE